MEHGVIIIVLSYRLTDLSCRKKFFSDEVNSVKSLFGSVNSPSFVANLYGVTVDAGGGGVVAENRGNKVPADFSATM